MSFLVEIKFNTDDWLTKIQTLQFNWKLVTTIIKRPSEGSLGLDRQSVLIKRETQALLI